MDIVVVISRWIHVITACIAIGSVFFMRVIVPAGLAHLDDAPRRETFLRLRRLLKPVIHTAILLFLLTGAFNAWRAWPQYNLSPGLTHGLFGMHLLLALVVFTISLITLKGAEPPKAHKGWMAANVVLLLVVVAFASTLKTVREKAVANAPREGTVTAAEE